MQSLTYLHPHQGYTATVVDGGWMNVREECKPSEPTAYEAS